MAELTRRRFLTYTSLGVAGAAVAAVGGAELVSRAGAAGAGSGPHTEPIVLMVRDAARAEVTLMVGTSERIYRDQDLVERLVGAAAQVGR